VLNPPNPTQKPVDKTDNNKLFGLYKLKTPLEKSKITLIKTNIMLPFLQFDILIIRSLITEKKILKAHIVIIVLIEFFIDVTTTDEKESFDFLRLEQLVEIKLLFAVSLKIKNALSNCDMYKQIPKVKLFHITPPTHPITKPMPAFEERIIARL